MASIATDSNERTTVDYLMGRDATFRYMLLDRLRSDCEYYLHHGNRSPRCLWTGNEAEQIEIMIKLHNSFKEGEKPEWLTMDKIIEYGTRMMTEEE